jgi:anti-sigma regulatory factor (Ser/Thr protein kinase)
MQELVALIVTNDKALEEVLQGCLTASNISMRNAHSFDDIHALIDDPKTLVSTIVFDIPQETEKFEHQLKALKRRKEAKYIPCVGILSDISQSETIAHQYFFHILAMPLHGKILPHTIEAAQSDFRRYQALMKEVSSRTSAIGLINSGKFTLQSLKEAEALTTMLSLACPEPSAVALGLSELLVNAIEHGNLNITYQEKSKLLETGNWNAEIERRLEDERYRERLVEIFFQRVENQIEITITDQGNGFDWNKYLTDDADKGSDMHGRGIAVAAAIGFSNLSYNDKGNQVTATIKL